MIKKSFMFMSLFLLAGLIRAGLPQQMNYQGRMLTPAGAPVADALNNAAVFTIYNAAVGGAALWTESRTGITTTAGLFNVMLGEMTPINLSFNVDTWLGIAWAGDAEMTPRQKLSTAPYAFRAKFLDVPATIAGTTGPVLNVQNSGTGIGLAASTSDPAGAAFTAQNTASTGLGYAIYGNSQSVAGTSVFGLQNVGANTGIGVYAANFGVGNTGAGLRGSNSSAQGIGVIAENTGIGLGSAFGISATSASNSGIAGYFQSVSAVVAWGHSLGLSAVADTSGGTGLAAIASDGIAIYAKNFGPGGFKSSILADAVNTNHAIEGRQLNTGALGILGGSPFGMNAGVYGSGLPGVEGTSSTGISVGVHGFIASNGVDGRAGVAAQNTTFSAPGSPAVALDIDGGIAFKQRGSDDPSGEFSILLNIPASGSSYYATTTLSNNQIKANSIILLSVHDFSSAFPIQGTGLSANAISRIPGSADIEVDANLAGVCCLSPGTVTVQYLILNPH